MEREKREEEVTTERHDVIDTDSRDRQTGRQTGRQTERQTGRHVDR